MTAPYYNLLQMLYTSYDFISFWLPSTAAKSVQTRWKWHGILGTEIDNKLSFENHMKGEVCKFLEVRLLCQKDY